MHTFAFLRGIPACGAFVAPGRAAARLALAVCALRTLLTASPASAVTMIAILSPGQIIVNLAMAAPLTGPSLVAAGLGAELHKAIETDLSILPFMRLTVPGAVLGGPTLAAWHGPGLGV